MNVWTKVSISASGKQKQFITNASDSKDLSYNNERSGILIFCLESVK